MNDARSGSVAGRAWLKLPNAVRPHRNHLGSGAGASVLAPARPPGAMIRANHVNDWICDWRAWDAGNHWTAAQTRTLR